MGGKRKIKTEEEIENDKKRRSEQLKVNQRNYRKKISEQKKLNKINEICVPSTSRDTSRDFVIIREDNFSTLSNAHNRFCDNESRDTELYVDNLSNNNIIVSNIHDHDSENFKSFTNIELSINHDHCYFSQKDNDNVNVIQSNVQNLNVAHSSLNGTLESSNISNNVINLVIDHDHCYFSQNIQSNNVPLPLIHQTNDVPEITENFIGQMNVECTHCKAKHFPNERVANKGDSFNDCCNHGNVELLLAPEFPIELKKLFDSEHELSPQFFQSIRLYNNLFSFASFNANLVNFNNRRPGPYCFKIQGQIYYQINTALHPTVNEKPSYGQLFIIDANEAIEHRMTAFNKDVHIDIVKVLEKIMRDYNIFAQSYEMMGDELKKQENCQSHQELQLLFSLKSGENDKRRYNFQRANEVAAIFSTTADGEIPDAYVIISNKDTKELQRVSSMDPNVEPWIYPLFYPHGSRGWHKDMYRKDGKSRVSRAAYIKHKIAIRDEFNPLIRGRRLFQQYLVDSYVKIEKDRIEYCKSHQAQLRVASYKGVRDYLEKKTNNNENARVGKIQILPSTFIGSPRYMLQCYHDAMTQTQKKGKPDLFITMTCNPHWKEIEDNLLPGQQPSDRPDICTRVFHLKKNALLHSIVKEKFFGEVSAYIYVIEFQKRGLPHCHLLITLSQNSKINTVQKIDSYISAEIPDPDFQPQLHNIVMKNMIHGPCGDWCIVNGKCSKNFPKQFQEETIIGGNSYPIYCRRDTGKTYMRPKNYKIDNRYVVPYCPMLSLQFNCHINVEVCSSIQSIKYIHKYIYKGHDAASVVITNNTNETVIEHDEIKQFVETRYVGPSEAVWRILSKPLHDKSHTIVRLPVHLPNFHNVTIHTNPDEQEIENALDQVTMLMDYFALNARDPEARNYLYADIPVHYVFKTQNVNGKKESKWHKRKRYTNCIGRMYTVSPSQVELFHLRILLMRVKGATSFEHLRTVNGEIKENFTAVCLSLGFIGNDEEWLNTIREAAIFMMPR